MNKRYLPTYLNDHLAGATDGTELSKRAASSNEGTEYGDFLAELSREIAEDRATLELLMDRLDVKKDPIKTIAARAAERIGRLKPNAHLTSYSPLSRLEELEILVLGVTGKLGLWKALLALAPTDDRLDAEELDVLIDRAARQLQGVESHRLRAAEEALA
jgi:hypothetical protein